MSSITTITSTNANEFFESNKDSCIVLFFDAKWTGQSDLVEGATKALNDAYKQLGDKFVIGLVDVEENNDLATKFSIQSVPIVVCQFKSKTTKKIDTIEPNKLITIVKEELKKQSLLDVSGGEQSADSTADQKSNSKQKFNDYLKQLVGRSHVMIFMKGEPKQPRCGFSRQLVELLSQYSDVKYDTFDILLDEEVRQGLKEYSDWPTYPQIYVKGEFIGGLDILKQLHETGELKSTLIG